LRTQVPFTDAFNGTAPSSHRAFVFHHTEGA
jgi:hypothetical protein